MTRPADSAARYFGDFTAEYDDIISRAVPRYREMHAQLLQFLPPGPARILELGCGTGTLTLGLSAKYPEAAITVVDASPEMITTCRARLQAVGRDATAVTDYFEKLRFDAGSFDLVTSAISLHHVLDKQSLFDSVRRWLTPGGTFRFADQFAGGTGWNHGVNWQAWLDHLRGDGNVAEEWITSLVEHAERHDHYVSVREHFRMLENAGFTGVDCVWRSTIWGVITADAPAPPLAR